MESKTIQDLLTSCALNTEKIKHNEKEISEMRSDVKEIQKELQKTRLTVGTIVAAGMVLIALINLWTKLT